MKNSITLLSSILILTLFTSCASSQFDKKPPFTIATAQHQEWTGGKPNSKGTLITIEFAEKVNETIIFDSIYFNGKSIPLNVEYINEKTTLLFKTTYCYGNRLFSYYVTT